MKMSEKMVKELQENIFMFQDGLINEDEFLFKVYGIVLDRMVKKVQDADCTLELLGKFVK
jgi:hypothetical protein